MRSNGRAASTKCSAADLINSTTLVVEPDRSISNTRLKGAETESKCAICWGTLSSDSRKSSLARSLTARLVPRSITLTLTLTSSVSTRMTSPSEISSGSLETGAGVPAPDEFFGGPVSSGFCLGVGTAPGSSVSCLTVGAEEEPKAVVAMPKDSAAAFASVIFPACE